MAFQVNVVVFNELRRREQIANTRLNHRTLRDASNPFDLPENNFKKLFRFSKHTALFVIDELLPHMEEKIRSTKIPNFLKVLGTLSFLGKGSYQLDVGQNYLLGLSQPSTSRMIEEVVTAINIHLSNWIDFPTTQNKKEIVKHRFQEKFHFPGVIGAIDCTHVAIVAPPANDPQFPGRIYFNRKRYTSINTQIICDSDLNILAINVRFPGSSHDAATWETSNIKTHLKTNFLNGDENTYILGDSGYPLQPWLLTPVQGAVNGTPEHAYNERHILTRNCIERLNGVLKSRWRCLLRHRVLHYHPTKAAKVIYACAILHNIGNNFNDDLPEDAVDDEHGEDDNDLADANNNWLNEGRRIRGLVIQNLFHNV